MTAPASARPEACVSTAGGVWCELGLASPILAEPPAGIARRASCPAARPFLFAPFASVIRMARGHRLPRVQARHPLSQQGSPVLIDLHTFAFFSLVFFVALGGLLGLAGVWIDSFWESETTLKLFLTNGILAATSLIVAVITKWLG